MNIKLLTYLENALPKNTMTRFSSLIKIYDTIENEANKQIVIAHTFTKNCLKEAVKLLIFPRLDSVE